MERERERASGVEALIQERPKLFCSGRGSSVPGYGDVASALEPGRVLCLERKKRAQGKKIIYRRRVSGHINFRIRFTF
jgi:hypothetical protein